MVLTGASSYPSLKEERAGRASKVNRADLFSGKAQAEAKASRHESSMKAVLRSCVSHAPPSGIPPPTRSPPEMCFLFIFLGHVQSGNAVLRLKVCEGAQLSR